MRDIEEEPFITELRGDTFTEDEVAEVRRVAANLSEGEVHILFRARSHEFFWVKRTQSGIAIGSLAAEQAEKYLPTSQGHMVH